MFRAPYPYPNALEPFSANLSDWQVVGAPRAAVFGFGACGADFRCFVLFRDPTAGGLAFSRLSPRGRGLAPDALLLGLRGGRARHFRVLPFCHRRQRGGPGFTWVTGFSVSRFLGRAGQRSRLHGNGQRRRGGSGAGSARVRRSWALGHASRVRPFMAQRPPQLIDQLALRRDLRAQRCGVRFQGSDAGGSLPRSALTPAARAGAATTRAVGENRARLGHSRRLRRRPPAGPGGRRMGRSAWRGSA